MSRSTNVIGASLAISLIAIVQVSTASNAFAAVQRSEKASEVEGYIINGDEAKPNSWPWMARLSVGCGASVISPRFLLTAGHCTSRPGQVVIFGAHNLTKRDSDEPTRTRRNIKRWIPHPQYGVRFLENDIAIIELDQPLNYTAAIQPIGLPSHTNAKSNLTGTQVTLTGWGRPRQSSNAGSPVLRQATTPVISNYECHTHLIKNRSAIKLVPTHLCTSHVERKTVCHGDSGSATNWKRPDGKYVQVGVISFIPGGICDKEGGVPSGHARVTSYLKWISEVTGIPIDN